VPEQRDRVNAGMDVCAECSRWVEEMRFLVQRYDQTRSVKGCKAFDEFLKDRDNEQIYCR
jgi:glutaredoxin-related protein